MPSKAKAYIPIAAALLCAWEGLDLVAHHQAIDPPGVVTFCAGRTNYDDPTVRVGQKFTEEQCEKFVVPDVEAYNAQMHKCIPAQQPPHREAALTDFTYNEGEGTLCRSSVARDINNGNIEAGCKALLRYNVANGTVLRGLERRRKAEYALCLRED